MGHQNQHFSFIEKEPFSTIVETVGPHGPKLDIPSPEQVQVSDLILRSNTRPGFTPSVGVSDSDSFAINPATLESGGFWEGHQSSFKTSDTQCHENLSIPERARSTLFQRMCAPLGEPENWLAHGCNQSTSSWNLEKEFYDMPPLVWLLSCHFLSVK
jgi:hypothetical protein